jgi:high-affinity nickel-transport protein
MLTFVGALLLGLVHGVRHAFEPDHLAAVSTLVADGTNPRRSAWLGAWWGAGHTASLLAVALVLTALRVEMPAQVGEGLEFLVACMLVALGTRAVVRGVVAMRSGAVEHRHGAVAHVHRGPFAVGTVHGLAGSGGLFALAAAMLPDVGARLAYVGVFGLGSVIGMAMLSGLAGAPLARIGQGRGWASIAAGGVATVLGVAWGAPFVLRWL